jgi:DnaK suppressor protein
MNFQHYKQRLLALETALSSRINREAEQGRADSMESVHDAGDASVADEMASQDFAAVERDADVLQQVRDALNRVADGSFGRCTVDGGTIEQQRLEALPWTPYCLKHAQEIEIAALAN